MYTEQEDVEVGQNHPPGTLVISTGGPHANKMSNSCRHSMAEFVALGLNGVEALSKFDNKNR